MRYRFLSLPDYPVSKWAHGETAEIYIAPPFPRSDAEPRQEDDSGDRTGDGGNHDANNDPNRPSFARDHYYIRISLATVESERATFSALPRDKGWVLRNLTVVAEEDGIQRSPAHNLTVAEDGIQRAPAHNLTVVEDGIQRSAAHRDESPAAPARGLTGGRPGGPLPQQGLSEAGRGEQQELLSRRNHELSFPGRDARGEPTDEFVVHKLRRFTDHCLFFGFEEHVQSKNKARNFNVMIRCHAPRQPSEPVGVSAGIPQPAAPPSQQSHQSQNATEHSVTGGTAPTAFVGGLEQAVWASLRRPETFFDPVLPFDPTERNVELLRKPLDDDYRKLPEIPNPYSVRSWRLCRGSPSRGEHEKNRERGRGICSESYEILRAIPQAQKNEFEELEEVETRGECLLFVVRGKLRVDLGGDLGGPMGELGVWDSLWFCFDSFVEGEAVRVSLGSHGSCEFVRVDF